MSKDGINILLYSDDADTRQAVIEGVGLVPAKGLPSVDWTEAATAEGAIAAFVAERPEVLVFDAEAAKVGGMALARRLENEYDADGIPLVLLTARPQDKWLATWAKADVVIMAPLDPIDLQEGIAKAIQMVR